MLVPHDVAVRVAVALTWVAGLALARVRAAACCPSLPDESKNPAVTAAAARHAAALAARNRVPPCRSARAGRSARAARRAWRPGDEVWRPGDRAVSRMLSVMPA